MYISKNSNQIAMAENFFDGAAKHLGIKGRMTADITDQLVSLVGKEYPSEKIKINEDAVVFTGYDEDLAGQAIKHYIVHNDINESPELTLTMIDTIAEYKKTRDLKGAIYHNYATIDMNRRNLKIEDMEKLVNRAMSDIEDVMDVYAEIHQKSADQACEKLNTVFMNNYREHVKANVYCEQDTEIPRIFRVIARFTLEPTGGYSESREIPMFEEIIPGLQNT